MDGWMAPSQQWGKVCVCVGVSKVCVCMLAFLCSNLYIGVAFLTSFNICRWVSIWEWHCMFLFVCFRECVWHLCSQVHLHNACVRLCVWTAVSRPAVDHTVCMQPQCFIYQSVPNRQAGGTVSFLIFTASIAEGCSIFFSCTGLAFFVMNVKKLASETTLNHSVDKSCSSVHVKSYSDHVFSAVMITLWYKCWASLS